MRALLVLLFFAAPVAASAGAWTRPEGTLFTIQSVRAFSTTLTSGDDPPFYRASTQIYAEYGLTDTITLGGEGEFGQRGDGRQEGVLRGFARARLWRGAAGDVISAEIGAGWPLYDVTTPFDISRDVTADARAGIAYGRGVETRLGAGWLDAALTLRHRRGPPADELKLDLTAGLRPTENWLTMAQIFTTKGLRNNGFTGADFDVVKLSLSLGYRITGARTLVFSLTQDVLGRNISLGSEAAISLWTDF